VVFQKLRHIVYLFHSKTQTAEVLTEKRIKSDSTNINDIGGAMPTSKRGRTIKTSDKR
jgi:hypothetical protein